MGQVGDTCDLFHETRKFRLLALAHFLFAPVCGEMALIFSPTLVNLPVFSFAAAEAITAANSQTDKREKGYEFFHEEYIHSYQGKLSLATNS